MYNQLEDVVNEIINIKKFVNDELDSNGDWDSTPVSTLNTTTPQQSTTTTTAINKKVSTVLPGAED